MPAFKFWRNHEPAAFVTAYVVSGLVAVLIPVIKHSSSIRSYNQYQNYYNNNNQEEENNSGDRSWTDINNCKWWKIRCTSVWVNENGVRTKLKYRVLVVCCRSSEVLRVTKKDTLQ
jgi:hypothetical protein